MFGDGPLTFREFAARERVPLAMIQEAVLEFLERRDDAAVFGAQAVNAESAARPARSAYFMRRFLSFSKRARGLYLVGSLSSNSWACRRCSELCPECR